MSSRALVLAGLLLALPPSASSQKRSTRLGMQARSYQAESCAFKVTDLRISGMKIVPDGPNACEGYIRFTADRKQHDIKFMVRPGTLADAPRHSEDWQHDDSGWHLGEESRVSEVPVQGGAGRYGEAPAVCTGDVSESVAKMRYAAIASNGVQVVILDGGACEDADPAGLKLLLSAWQFQPLKTD